MSLAIMGTTTTVGISKNADIENTANDKEANAINGRRFGISPYEGAAVLKATMLPH
jgi:hypothetical protein